MKPKKILVCGGGGFIGHNLVKRLKSLGHYVVAIDLKWPLFEQSPANEFYKIDLTDYAASEQVFKLHYTMPFDEVYQLAADMGGAGYIFSGDNDVNIMRSSVMINVNMQDLCLKYEVGKVFYSSSACIYPQELQTDVQTDYSLRESHAYPANPDSEYGWEKIFSERLYIAANRVHKQNVRIARFHNIYGVNGVYEGGKEKAPAAICRKVAMANDGDFIEVWGDGKQKRSFLYIDECLNGIARLMESDITEPINIGSSEMVSINELAEMAIQISGKKLYIKYVPGFIGVHGRNSNNELIEQKLGWKPDYPLIDGLTKTYDWINSQIQNGKP